MSRDVKKPSLDVVELPKCNHDDPNDLASWHGPYGNANHFRKIRLANAREIVRAKAIMAGVKLTETRIDDLARQEDVYIEFVRELLDGRRAYEAEQRAAGVGA